MTLYAHQKSVIKDDPKKALIAFGTGTGKTRLALLLAKGRTLVIAPKQTQLDRTFEREAESLGLKTALTVVSKEKFKKHQNQLGHFNTLIIDEAHSALGVTPAVRTRNRIPQPKSSQIFEAVYSFIKKTNPPRVYLLTATPTRNPLCVFAAGALLGKWDLDKFWKFRQVFYFKLPMTGREAWKARADETTKQRLGKVVRSLGYTARLSDLFDVPPQVEKTIRIPLTRQQKDNINWLPLAYPDPLVLLGKIHQAEQGIGRKGDDSTFDIPTGKLEAIADFAHEFPKLAVFARYRLQIDRIASYLARHGFKTVKMMGDTADRDKAVTEANKASQCVFICQSQIGAGFELPEYECAVWASLDYSHVNYEQNKGRILRANNLGKRLYVVLLSGDVDEAVWQAIKNKKDFHQEIFAKENKFYRRVL